MRADATKDKCGEFDIRDTTMCFTLNAMKTGLGAVMFIFVVVDSGGARTAVTKPSDAVVYRGLWRVQDDTPTVLQASRCLAHLSGSLINHNQQPGMSPFLQ